MVWVEQERGARGLRGQLQDTVQEGRAGLAVAPCVWDDTSWPSAVCPRLVTVLSFLQLDLLPAPPSAEEELRADGEVTRSGSH